MAVPLHYPASSRQYIQRIPAYLPMETTKVSYSPSGSWRTVSADSKSASISSGYGTPKVLQVDSYCCQHHPSHSGSTSSGASRIYYTKPSDLNGSSDTLVEDGAIWPGKKSSYKAIKRRSSDEWHMHFYENSTPLNNFYTDTNPPVPPRRRESRRHPNRETIWSFEQHQHSPPNIPRSQVRHSDKRRHDYYPDYWCHHNDSRHSMHMSSSNSGSYNDVDEDFSPIGLSYPLSSGLSKPISALDEEATQIYNEILDVAGSLAYDDQRNKISEGRLSDLNHDKRKSRKMFQSLHDLQSISPQKETFDKAIPQPFPRPQDKRRSRISDYERTPTNVPSLWLHIGQTHEKSQETVIHTSDSDTESALAALDNAVNFGFLEPAAYREPEKCKFTGPTPIIREYIGESEDDRLKLQARNLNGKESPTSYSVIEIDDISEDEDKRRIEALPLDDIETKLLTPIHAFHIDSPIPNSDSFNALTPTEDLSYMSDIDI